MEAYSAIMAIAHEIKHARRTIALTGAGISAESGLATFRGGAGLWTEHDPAEVASMDSFARDPRGFWKFAREIGSSFLTAQPNAAHKALAELEQMKHLDCIITQNIDGLHQRAGSRHVIEIHGSVERVDCTSCDASYATREILDRLIRQDVPRCDRCGGILKPNAILFGEEIPKKILNQALDKVRSADLLLSVGTSLEVYPAASFPETAKEFGAKVVSINTEMSVRGSVVDYEVPGSAGEILPGVIDAIRIAI